MLARIRATEYQDKVHQAASQTEAAQAAAAQGQARLRPRHTPLRERESDEARVRGGSCAIRQRRRRNCERLRHQTAEAQVSLRDTTLVAPFSGDIVKKAVELGSFVGPGVPTFAVAKTDTVKIVVGVPDTACGQSNWANPLRLRSTRSPTRTFSARISRISSAADTMYAQLRRRGRNTEPRPLAEGGHDRFLQLASRWRTANSKLSSLHGSAFGDRAGE